MKRVHNFNAGPSTLPLPVLQQVQDELLDYQGTGMSVMEMSHRTKPIEAIHARAVERLRRILSIPSNYHVLFMQGGASTQFALVPMNLVPQEGTADYVVTGAFAQKAYEEAATLGEAHVAASTKAEKYRRIPDQSEIHLSANPAYVHLTSNNTIFGTQWRSFPAFGDVPVVCDMSSDFLSRPVDVSKFGLIYAGAQKNVGPAGVTVAIVRDDLLAPKRQIPAIFRYETFAKSESMYNTPPVFSVYVMNLVLAWIEEQGGAAAMHTHNEQKARVIYEAIDASGGFYAGHAEKGSRSMMNITFRLPSEELEKACISEAEKAGLIGIKGHRSVGGMRISNYNAMTMEGCVAARDFLLDFARRNG